MPKNFIKWEAIQHRTFAQTFPVKVAGRTSKYFATGYRFITLQHLLNALFNGRFYKLMCNNCILYSVKGKPKLSPLVLVLLQCEVNSTPLTTAAKEFPSCARKSSRRWPWKRPLGGTCSSPPFAAAMQHKRFSLSRESNYSGRPAEGTDGRTALRTLIWQQWSSKNASFLPSRGLSQQSWGFMSWGLILSSGFNRIPNFWKIGW